MTALIGFIRALERELNERADGWARDASNNASADIKEKFSITSSVLRELSGAIGAAAKRTLFA